MLKYVDYSGIKKKSHLEAIEGYKLLRQLPDSPPMLIVDQDFRVIFVNNNFRKYFDVKEGDLISKLNSEPKIENVILGLRESNYESIEAEMYFSDNGYNNVKVHIERALIESNEYVICWFVFENPEIKFEEKINNFYSALEHSNIPLMIINSEGYILYSTPAFENVLDLNLETLFNNSLLSIFSFYLSQSELASLSTALSNRTTWYGSISYENKKREISFFDLILEPINSSNESWSFIFRANDITNHIQKNRVIKKSERRLKSIINNITDLLLIISKKNDEYVFVTANDNFCNAFEINKDIAEGKKIEDLLEEILVNNFYGAIDKLNKENSFDTTFKFDLLDGKIYFAKMIEIDDNLENEKLYVISINDITERELYEKQLRKAYEKELHLNKLKSTFLENMSHEIRTPINAINGYSEIIDDALKTKDYESVVEFIGILKDVFARVMNLFSNIVELSQIESGETEIEFVKLNCNKVLKSVYGKKLEDAEKKKLKFYLILEKEDVLINADWVKLEKVIYALVDNAIKFTDEGEVILSSRLSGNELQIIVSDTGNGIDKLQLKRILEPFAQEAEEAYTRAYDGAGLGLTIAYKLTSLMNGRFYIQSDKKNGTKVTLSFNVVK
ncbi:ATP-binding protein [Melioribacteraceae bacterium 4301-Me]|uniref:sensor histidine kinase n=1 Tax=Pyranulibacter aquaticus TaxID=3163344 RepID=UPI0035973F84